jgi:hypothetical protein
MVLFDTSSFQGICLDYFVFQYLKNTVFKNRPGTIPELMQAIPDTVGLKKKREMKFDLM